jgi:hypothetical protein
MTLGHSHDAWYGSLPVNHHSTTLVLFLTLSINTAQVRTASPHFVIAASGMHHKTSIIPDVRSVPAILEKVLSKEHCTKQFVFPTSLAHQSLLTKIQLSE